MQNLRHGGSRAGVSVEWPGAPVLLRSRLLQAFGEPVLQRPRLLVSLDLRFVARRVDAEPLTPRLQTLTVPRGLSIVMNGALALVRDASGSDMGCRVPAHRESPTGTPASCLLLRLPRSGRPVRGRP